MHWKHTFYFRKYKYFSINFKNINVIFVTRMMKKSLGKENKCTTSDVRCQSNNPRDPHVITLLPLLSSRWIIKAHHLKYTTRAHNDHRGTFIPCTDGDYGQTKVNKSNGWDQSLSGPHENLKRQKRGNAFPSTRLRWLAICKSPRSPFYSLSLSLSLSLYIYSSRVCSSLSLSLSLSSLTDLLENPREKKRHKLWKIQRRNFSRIDVGSVFSGMGLDHSSLFGCKVWFFMFL